MSSYARISSDDAKTLMENGDVNIIDIRDLASFNAGHITDAEHVDNHSIAAYIQDTDQDVPLIVCCYHGNSSQSAGAYMAEQGFETVYSLDGGYTEWVGKYPSMCEKEPGF